MSDEPIVWSDIHHNFEIDAKGDIRKAVNIAAVKTSIDNILRTIPGERVMLPTFAAGLQDLVFEPTDARVYSRISDRIKDAINVWDTRVIVQKVDLVIDADNSSVTIKMQFAIKGYDQIFTHETTV
jgi:hypothetical protein